MTTIRQNTRSHLSLALVVAITLTSLCYQQQVEATSQIEQTPSFTKFEDAPKVSPLLKPGKHGRDERVSVILELNSPAGRSLGAFLKQDGIRLRRELNRSRILSITLPFNKVAELSSFSEVFHVSTNDAISPVGHVTATTGTDAARAAASGTGIS